jgi:peroxiredoxin Q/BCP
MDGLGTLSVSIGLVLVAAASSPAQRAVDLKPDDPAPAFVLPGSDGRTYSLADFKGRQAVVLAWFPKAFTGG